MERKIGLLSLFGYVVAVAVAVVSVLAGGDCVLYRCDCDCCDDSEASCACEEEEEGALFLL